MRNRIISQPSIFFLIDNGENMDDREFGDLRRLIECMKQIPYHDLIDKLFTERGRGRNDNPPEVMFTIVIAQFVFQELDVEGMRRELGRNPTLRTLVGISDYDTKTRNRSLVPTPSAFSRFYELLMKHQDDLDAIFDQLLVKVSEKVPEFGKYVSGDGKYVDSFTPNAHSGEISPTFRADHEAKYSIKEYHYIKADGTKGVRKETHFGYRKHTIVDSTTELPIISFVAPANYDEKKALREMLANYKPELRERMKEMALDRGYDATDIFKLIRSMGAIPFVDKRSMRAKGSIVRYKKTNFYYNESGVVYYYDGSTEKYSDDGERLTNPETDLSYGYHRAYYCGYEESRGTLKYKYGSSQVRIKISDDPRVFNEVTRHSKRYQRHYNMRTSVERYHARLDDGFGFEKHTIKGLAKMRMMLKLADIVMLALALVHIEHEQENVASLFNFGFI